MACIIMCGKEVWHGVHVSVMWGRGVYVYVCVCVYVVYIGVAYCGWRVYACECVVSGMYVCGVVRTCMDGEKVRHGV